MYLCKWKKHSGYHPAHVLERPAHRFPPGTGSTPPLPLFLVCARGLTPSAPLKPTDTFTAPAWAVPSRSSFLPHGRAPLPPRTPGRHRHADGSALPPRSARLCAQPWAGPLPPGAYRLHGWEASPSTRPRTRKGAPVPVRGQPSPPPRSPHAYTPAAALSARRRKTPAHIPVCGRYRVRPSRPRHNRAPTARHGPPAAGPQPHAPARFSQHPPPPRRPRRAHARPPPALPAR